MNNKKKPNNCDESYTIHEEYGDALFYKIKLSDTSIYYVSGSKKSICNDMNIPEPVTEDGILPGLQCKFGDDVEKITAEQYYADMETDFKDGIKRYFR